MSVLKHLKELMVFGLKQAYACVFGGFLLAVMIITNFWYPFESLHRYDFIFFSAIVFQLILLIFKLETPREAVVILVFHIAATGLEVFKTSDSIASWSYPEAYVFGVGNVPLFAGFMYSAVGSYIARIWRIFDFEFSNYPKKSYSLILVALIYINLFSHHFIIDLRWMLLLATVLMFYKTNIHFKITEHYRNMPILAGWILVASFIWIAENIATYANIWIYPSQQSQWHMVPLTKLVAWFLLMLLSFVLVSLVNQMAPYRGAGNSVHENAPDHCDENSTGRVV